jgi:hypothetical protein
MADGRHGKFRIFAAMLLALPLAGAVKVTVVDGRPLVDGVYVNGQGPYRFLLDTATTMNHMDPDLARSIGLIATFRTELYSSVGTVVATGAEGVAVALGEALADNQKFLFAGMDVVHQLAGNIHGILGQNFLGQFDYLLDLRAGRLEFGKQPSSGRRAQFRLVEGRSAILTSLGELVLDSGAATLILFGVPPETGAANFMKTMAGSRSVGTIRRNLSIAGQRIWRGDAVAVPDRTEMGVAGLMPLSLFRSIYICNSESYVAFQ